MSVVITTYTLASGLMQQGMNWWQAMVTILLGNTDRARADGAERARRHQVRHLVPGALPRELRRARREPAGDAPRDRRLRLVRDPDLDRRRWRSTRCSGRRGRAGPACRASTAIAFMVFWLIQVAVILKGTEGIKLLESWSAPLLLAGGGDSPALGHQGAAAGSATCWRESEQLRGRAALRSGRCSRRRSPRSVGYWATLSLNIPDFTRYAKSQRSQMLGQALGLPTTMTAFAFIGVAVTSATIVRLRPADLGSGRADRPDRRHRA